MLVRSSLASGSRRLRACLLRRSMSSSSIIPVIDLGKPRHEAAEEIAQACREIGFLSIVNHGVAPELMARMQQTTEHYFDLQAEEKKQIEMSEEYPYGYSGFAEENLSAGYDEGGKPDLKECFAIGPSNPAAGMPLVRWPANPPEMREVWGEYWSSMDALSLRVLNLFGTALGQGDNWFDDKTLRHRSALRALNYPQQDAPPEPGQIRCGAHTDYGTITILKQDKTGGLQVRDRNHQWHDVPYMEDAFVLNLGDLMQRWTNDKWVSTLHRVVNPPTYKGNRRQSIAYFQNIDHDYLVECIPSCQSAEHPAKYPPILAWDHIMEKHLASTGGKPEIRE